MTCRRVGLTDGRYVVRATDILALRTAIMDEYQLEAVSAFWYTERDTTRNPARDRGDDLKSQFVTSSWGGLRRAMPYAALTEQGGAKLLSAARSPRPARLNIALMR
jgi:hypothetical protein